MAICPIKIRTHNLRQCVVIVLSFMMYERVAGIVNRKPKTITDLGDQIFNWFSKSHPFYVRRTFFIVMYFGCTLQDYNYNNKLTF